jgi:hypothetical protein
VDTQIGHLAASCASDLSIFFSLRYEDVLPIALPDGRECGAQSHDQSGAPARAGARRACSVLPKCLTGSARLGC